MALLALVAVLARALVPAGYMLAPAADGRFVAITLCSGYGPVESLLDLTTGALSKPDSGQEDNSPSEPPGAHGPCVFAAMASLSTPQDAAPIEGAHGYAFAAPGRAGETAPGRGLAAPPPWSTGPPLTA